MKDFYDTEKETTIAIAAIVNTITVQGEAVVFYTSGFEGKNMGVYMEQFSDREDGSKSSMAGEARISLVAFTIGKTKEVHSELTSKLRRALKASAGSKLELSSGLAVTYILTPTIVTTTLPNTGSLVEHRASVEMVIRIHET